MSSPTEPRPTPVRNDRTHFLYIAVIVAVLLGIGVGFLFPDFAVELEPLGTGFVNLIKMMIGPIIFCTIVLGIGSVRQAASVGKVGGLALGLLPGDVDGRARDRPRGRQPRSSPAPGCDLTDTAAQGRPGSRPPARTEGTDGLPARHHPEDAVVLADRGRGAAGRLLVALLVGFALQAMGATGEPVLTASDTSSGWSSRSCR